MLCWIYQPIAASAPHGSDWIDAWSIASYSLRLDMKDVRLAFGSHLGTALCMEELCPNGASVDCSGTHSTWAKNPGKHATENDIVCCALARSSIHCVKELAWLSRIDGKRPVGLTLIFFGNSENALSVVTFAIATAILYFSAQLAENRKHASILIIG